MILARKSTVNTVLSGPFQVPGHSQENLSATDGSLWLNLLYLEEVTSRQIYVSSPRTTHVQRPESCHLDLMVLL